MTTTLPGAGLPHWVQLLVAVVAVLGFVGGAAAFLFVIWPSIRRADKRADRIEKWIDGPEGQAAYKKFTEFLRKGLVEGTPQDPGEFLREDTGKEPVRGKL